MRVRSSWYLVAFAAFAATGCAGWGSKKPTAVAADVPVGEFGTAASGEAPKPEPVWRAALLQTECPVDTGPSQTQIEAGFGGVLDTIIGFGVDTIFSSLFKSIQDAAKADRDGKTFSTAHAWNFYSLKRSTKETPWEKNNIKRAKCIVIARGTHRDSGASWCPDPVTSGNSAMEKACKFPTRVNPAAEVLKLEKPSFFAQIELRSAITSGALIGDLTYVWYPTALTTRSGATRDLLIGAALRKPHAEIQKGDVYAQFTFPLKKLKPGETVVLDGSSRWQLPFHGFAPAEPSAEVLKLAQTINTDMLHFGPVNLDVFVQETGDLNQFLQKLDELLNKTDIEGQITGGVKSMVVPGLREAAEAQTVAAEVAATNAANNARLALCTARAEYMGALAAVASPDNDEGRAAKKAKLDTLWFKWQIAAKAVPADSAKECAIPGAPMH